MKKLMIYFASLVMVLTFNACGGNDDDDNEDVTRTDIVGLWAEDASFSSMENFSYEFKSNGTLIWRCYNNKVLEQKQETSYTVSGDYIKSDNVKMYIKTCTSTQLIIVNTDDNETFTLTKVSSLP
jgi:hypothetical protein